jgi:hypothetical protein
MSHPSGFKTPEGEATYLAAYDAALRLWPVAYEEMNIPTRFGLTHVVVSGPKDAPALVLLHGYMATLIMWLPNIQDFSKDYRVYAIDVMGQPSKSIPGEPIRQEADYVAWLTAIVERAEPRPHFSGRRVVRWLAGPHLRGGRTGPSPEACASVCRRHLANCHAVQTAWHADGLLAQTLHRQLVRALGGIDRCFRRNGCAACV